MKAFFMPSWGLSRPGRFPLVAIALSVVLALAAGALAGAGPARASNVTIDYYVTDETMDWEFGCSAPIQGLFQGTLSVKNIFGQDGNVARSIATGASPWRLTLTANGKTLVSQVPYMSAIVYTESIVGTMQAGLEFNFHAPGTGILLLETGVDLVLENNQLFAGPHQYMNGDTAALCAYFGL